MRPHKSWHPSPRQESSSPRSRSPCLPEVIIFRYLSLSRAMTPGRQGQGDLFCRYFLFEKASSRLKYSQYLYIPISQNRYQKENIKQSICREYFPLPGCWFVPKCCSHLPLPLSSLDDLWEIHVGIKLICFTNFGFILLPSLSERG